jgi:hypothetical protein
MISSKKMYQKSENKNTRDVKVTDKTSKVLLIVKEEIHKIQRWH